MEYNRKLLRDEMTRKGLTRKAIADLTGLSPITVNKCLNTDTGRPDSLYWIAKALGFKVKMEPKMGANGIVVHVYDLTPIVISKQ